MLDPRLIDYVNRCKQLKISSEEIVRTLLSAGWSKDVVEEAIRTKDERREVIVKMMGIFREHIINENVKIPALQGINLNIYKGEFVAITGPSGSGKTSLLNLIGLLDKPDSGEIFINGKDVNSFKEADKINFRLKSIGFVFQFFNLLDNYNAIDNIIFQLRLQGYSKKESREKSNQILDFLGLKERSHLFPNQLSGGEQQRLAIGRALAKDSLIILVDEPTAHLDSRNGQMVISLLREVNFKFKKTIVLVTHEPIYARMADRIVEIKDGRVKSIHEVTPDEMRLAGDLELSQQEPPNLSIS